MDMQTLDLADVAGLKVSQCDRTTDPIAVRGRTRLADDPPRETDRFLAERYRT